MARTFTAGQHALLEAALRQRLQRLDEQPGAQQQGPQHNEQAPALLQQHGDDAPRCGGQEQEQRQGQAARRLGIAWPDRGLMALGAVCDALNRLHNGDYGRCSDCGEDIDFDRLIVEPSAQRCVGCETQHARTGGMPQPT